MVTRVGSAASKAAELDALKYSLAAERESLVLWRRPLATTYYFCWAVYDYLLDLVHRLQPHKVSLMASAAVLAAVYLYLDAHQPVALQRVVDGGYLAYYWLGLGILSSVGLGTGLHTFVLYLVSIAAYYHKTTDFAPPFSASDSSTWSTILPAPGAVVNDEISMWDVVSFVRIPALLFGAGTAIGELPPYFVGRAAALSGMSEEVEDEDFQEYQETIANQGKQDFATKMKRTVVALVRSAGFWGILLCASIPNPLFDMAGIACGTCLVPFWTFFGATVIGKAFVKMHAQMLLEVYILSPANFQAAVEAIETVPLVGGFLRREMELHAERTKGMHAGAGGPDEKSVLQILLVVLVVGMVAAFSMSIVSQFAQGKKRRLNKEIILGREAKGQ